MLRGDQKSELPPCPSIINGCDSKGGGFLEKEVNSIKMVEIEKLILKQRKEVV